MSGANSSSLQLRRPLGLVPLDASEAEDFHSPERTPVAPTPTQRLPTGPSSRRSPVPVCIPEHLLIRAPGNPPPPTPCATEPQETRRAGTRPDIGDALESQHEESTSGLWGADIIEQTRTDMSTLFTWWRNGPLEKEQAARAQDLTGNSVVWLSAGILGALGFSWYVFAGIAILYCYFHTAQCFEEIRARQAHAAVASNVLALSPTPETEFRDYEVDWLNLAMDEFWPSSLGPWLTDLLRKVLGNLLSRRLSMLSANFDAFSLGERPPEIMRVREQIEDNKFTLDLDFAFECAGHARLLLNMHDLTHTAVELSEIRMRGVVRLVFMGFLPVVPYFAQLRISFVGRPDLDFLFSVALLGASTRGLERKVKDVLCKHALEQMVYPHSIPVHILGEMQLGTELWEKMQLRVPPCGILVVHLLRAFDLPAKDITGASDPYVTFQVGKQVHHSSTKKRTLKPDWGSETGGEERSFRVWQRALEVLHVEVFDEEFLRPAEHIGRCEIPLRSVFAECGDTTQPAEVKRGWRLYEDVPLNYAGTVELVLEWKPLETPRWNNPAPVLKRATRVPENLGDGKVKGVLEVDLDHATYPTEVKMETHITIRIIEDVEAVCDPVGRSKIAKCPKERMWKSPTKDSNNPIWRERALLDVHDAGTAVAHVEVVRGRKIEHAMQTETLGEFQVPLRAFFQLQKSSSDMEIQGFLPQCVEHRWDGDTIIPTLWKLAQREYESPIQTENARVKASFHFQLLRTRSSAMLESTATRSKSLSGLGSDSRTPTG